jgi:citrate lyase alpha subunit
VLQQRAAAAAAAAQEPPPRPLLLAGACAGVALFCGYFCYGFAAARGPGAAASALGAWALQAALGERSSTGSGGGLAAVLAVGPSPHQRSHQRLLLG